TNLFEPKAAVRGRATRWKFVTPARMFHRSALSLERVVPTVILRNGTENLLTYKSLDASGGSASRKLAWCGGGCFESRRRVNSTVRRHVDIRKQSGREH